MKKTISVSMVRHDGELNQALQRLAKTAVYVGIAAALRAIRETTAPRAITFWALCMRTALRRTIFRRDRS